MRNHRVAAGVLAVVLAIGAAAGCAGPSATERDRPAADIAKSTPFRILPDPEFGASQVAPRRLASIIVTAGALRSVKLFDAAGNSVAGKLSADKQSWQSAGKLAYDTKYRWRGIAVDPDDKRYQISGSFRTVKPDQLVTATTNVVDGGVYPNDLSIALTFSTPVKNREIVERALRVETSPRVTGSWKWSEDRRVALWEPRGKWRSGSKVKLSAELHGVMFGPGQYGADDRHFSFRITGG